MRPAAQIKRTPREWHDAQAAERRRILAALLEDLRRAREQGAEWYTWIAAGMPPLSSAEYAALHRVTPAAQSAPPAPPPAGLW